MANQYKIFYFNFQNTSGEEVKLRKRQLTAVKVMYREKGSTASFAETYDYNVDEYYNRLWVRLPYGNILEVSVVLNVGPLRTMQTEVIELDTTTKTGVLTEVQEAPLNSEQGYSPRLSSDGEWLTYDDEKQTFTGTGIYAINTTGSPHPIVDVIEKNNMSAVTSNAVYGLKNTLEQKIDNIDIKQYSVTVNDINYTADTNGVINLGTLTAEGGYNSVNTRMVESEYETVDGVIAPRGSLISTTAYGDTEKVVSLSNSKYIYQYNANVDGWCCLFNVSESRTIDITLTQYNTNYAGRIYIQRNGYQVVGTTTNQFIADKIKLYKSGYNWFVMVYGNSHVSCFCDVRCDQKLDWYGKGPWTINNTHDLGVYLTELNNNYETITASPYSVTASELTVTDYNVNVETCDFTFADELDYPISLRFVALQDNTTINVSDSTASWTASTTAMNQGTVAVLSWLTTTSYTWTYTSDKDFEVKGNKVSKITSTNSASTTCYPSVSAMVTYVNDAITGDCVDQDCRDYVSGICTWDTIIDTDETGKKYIVTHQTGATDIYVAISGSSELTYIFHLDSSSLNVADKFNIHFCNYSPEFNQVILIDDYTSTVIARIDGFYDSTSVYDFTKNSAGEIVSGGAYYVKMTPNITTSGIQQSIISSVTINGTAHTVVDNAVDLGDVGGGSTVYNYKGKSYESDWTATTISAESSVTDYIIDSFNTKITSAYVWSSTYVSSGIVNNIEYRIYNNASQTISLIMNGNSSSSDASPKYRVANGECVHIRCSTEGALMWYKSAFVVDSTATTNKYIQ